MEPVSFSMGLQVPGMQMGMVGHESNNLQSQLFSVSKEQMGLVEPMPSNPLFSTLMVPNNRRDESSGGGIASSPIWMSNQLGCEDALVVNNMTGYNTLLPLKRNSEMGPMSNSSISQQGLLPNKRPAHLRADVSSLGFLRPSATQTRTGPAQPSRGAAGLQTQCAVNKKMVQNDSMPGKSGSQRGRPAKKRTTQIESASKSQPESSEAVRSKMRESLAAALALASQMPDNVSNTRKDQNDATMTDWKPVNSQAYECNSSMVDKVPVSGSEEVFPPKELVVVGMPNDSRVLSAELPPQYGSILSDEDVQFSDNFLVKDDLLLGNGLSWELDFDVQMREGKEAQNADSPQSVKQESNGHRDRGDVAILIPENLAFKIEAELFKLFGGVNKKYKEKGRSLLFNLKDRNNPELRVRVMSGEISPERLCSMSAEELASKELSKWRVAKAEELAQMIVLPDTEVNIRRFVKKTHKGEYQVEYFEHDDGIVEEVSGGTSVLTQPQRKRETESPSPSKGGENVAVEEISSDLIIHTDGTDLMQGIIVDELKDAKLLPPVVSLDEFMESLNSDPPFENLSSEERPKVVDSRDAGRALDSPKDASSQMADAFKKHEVDMTMKPGGSPEQKVLPSIASELEYLWEGILQLNISASVTVCGLFQSGEKTSTKEWSTSLEIKGRVRLDAFEKFLRELPMSRTRAVMVLQFDLKNKSSKNELSVFSEAVDSYAADERLGYAEPAPGVELYLCPPTSRMFDWLNKHISKEDCPKNNNSMETGLVGIVVWRRTHITKTVSPSSSSQHKHSSKRQPLIMSNLLQDSSNVNVNNNVTHSKLDEDDIPPGFEPVAAARAANDEDDLPEFEFNFLGELNSSLRSFSSQNLRYGVKMNTNQRSVDEVRELVRKYGQSGNGGMSIGIGQWNDDDDDDIPEWRPEAPRHLHHQPYTVVDGHRLPAQLLQSSRHMAPPIVEQPLPVGFAGGRRVQPPGAVYGARWRLH